MRLGPVVSAFALYLGVGVQHGLQPSRSGFVRVGDASKKVKVTGDLLIDSDHLAIRTQPHLVVDAMESLLDAST